MARQKIKGLLTQLHERFASSETSAQQDALMQQLHSQLVEWDGPRPPDGNVVLTAELLREEFKEKHPHLSLLLREIIDELGKIGI